ncbi:arabinofuranan 3-O-arabinosyltransferase [Mycolicibacterium goodii]|uniref:Arabinofuranan 3-O-arabinosyltransferase n=1 Tax=Mycolicibacterium goodii TaxID=134601 RepID=A0ABS6HXU7_MYCGD|nr:arabinofuranan 3-O-arabinosyltransferase [Mycolicibacterium goodii]OKH65607.1 membrane protein [Mycobacterium sp. SWH-M5]MBU8810149.1 arabinofuranan 3-O-arabinosyltransferase [Mycolicibacterium goodii]MBU8816394.1 arabinofuranan 3-O-arabinosyltransferase [Mycolicibacterium goodii]MBU8827494.1 arabinofuranan 3-O-arabinosyltransferase [Mycolicibacterium goodii]MBU8841344.1 arabinofuranan 3-O-arabinosyltransferase [Mycolicibacterium goodii]
MYCALVAATDNITTKLLTAFRPRTSAPSTATVLRSVLWPIAILSIIHRSYVLGTNGYITDDFGPVYRAVVNFKLGLDIYNEHFDHVDPHYLYPPGGTLLLAPFGYLPVDASRYWFIFFNTLAVVVAAYFLVRLFKFSFTSVAMPALLLAMYCTESVTNTLVFTNINGCLLLCCVLFFRFLLDGRVSHELLAGAAIGLTLVVKPSLAPLLLLPLLNRQFFTYITAFGVPLAFNVVGWLLVPDPMGFVRNTVPYIFSTRDYFNSSIVGNGVYYGLPAWLILSLRVLFVLLAAGSLWLLYRYYRERDQLFWMLTSSGVLLITSYLVLSLGQGYYSMMLFPFLMTVVLPNSVLRNWPAWLAIYGFMTMDRWLLGHWPTTGRFLEYMKITYGWSLMLVVVFCVLYFRYLDAKQDGRLDQGIDPPWLSRQRTPAAA